MERSRSKRSYYYDQDYDSETVARTRPRYNHHHHHHRDSHRHRGGVGGGGGGGRHYKTQDSPLTVTTSYRLLCHDLRAGGVIGKSGSIIKSIRQHTGAWINVHEPVAGDEERIIEISDTRRRDPDGRMPQFSPAQEALLLIHERLLENDPGFEDEEDYGGGRGGGGGKRVSSRLVVSKMHVGSLLGKGGKIIEQMRIETKTQIRILPRDSYLPRCVSMSEEIVQVTGDINNVKNAFLVISSRLRESQHRDRSSERGGGGGGHFHGRGHSPERFFPPEDDYLPHVSSGSRRSSVERSGFGSRIASTNSRNNNHASLSYSMDQGAAPVAHDEQPFYEDLIFRILCPVDRVDRIVGESGGILELLQDRVGVDVKISDRVGGSDEQMVIITSEEGPNDPMFPAQEALLHIQTHIVDLSDSIITTRLIIPSSDIECLDGKNASLSEIERSTGASIQILPREELPPCIANTDELVQIVGEIEAARNVILDVTARLRSYVYRDILQRDTVPPSAPLPSVEASSSNSMAAVAETATANQNMQSVAVALASKESGGSSTEMGKMKESDRPDDLPSGLNRTVSLVTRSILEVVIPEYAVPRLLAKSKSKLAQISELSGANVKLVEDRPDEKEKIIQISGTPEQAERGQSLLQGFILSTQEDGP